jgi:hypothetical protein
MAVWDFDFQDDIRDLIARNLVAYQTYRGRVDKPTNLELGWSSAVAAAFA